mmetsp:Transcript_9059/g.17747  ORF Transcript_9059/g.17747 Transcript_9059/m.17747 type:complete len:287 (-) Transcript_9059:1707-2567(-)
MFNLPKLFLHLSPGRDVCSRKFVTEHGLPLNQQVEDQRDHEQEPSDENQTAGDPAAHLESAEVGGSQHHLHELHGVLEQQPPPDPAVRSGEVRMVVRVLPALPDLRVRSNLLRHQLQRDAQLCGDIGYRSAHVPTAGPTAAGTGAAAAHSAASRALLAPFIVSASLRAQTAAAVPLRKAIRVHARLLVDRVFRGFAHTGAAPLVAVARAALPLTGPPALPAHALEDQVHELRQAAHFVLLLHRLVEIDDRLHSPERLSPSSRHLTCQSPEVIQVEVLRHVHHIVSS